MNIFQSLNVGVFGLTIAALFGGVNRYPGSIGGLPRSLWLFVSFIFLLRLKMCMDDHKYFGFAKTKSPTFKAGFLLGFISWMFWGLAAWALPNPQTSYFLAGMAISVSTLWIVVAMARRGQAYDEQYWWIATNVIFVMLLWELHRRHTPQGDWITWVALSALVILVITDLALSKSIPELEN